MYNKPHFNSDVSSQSDAYVVMTFIWINNIEIQRLYKCQKIINVERNINVK